jgi:DNA-binding SARP family transcriptional activator
VPGGLDVRILGPLSIERDGAPLALGGMQQRAVLAALLLQEGHVVPADSLIDLLWGESQPPPTARTTMQGYISKLRKLLTAAAPMAVLETEGAGYRLKIDPECFDLRRFEALAESGRTALAGGDPTTASRVLTEALGLWRGLPLGDLDVPGTIGFDVVRLEELRIAALESRLEADLALGRHAEVIPELEQLLADQPMNERLHALAALSLYRAGRVGDALEVAERLRRHLSQELGIEPSAAIQLLHQDILNRSPSLDLPASDTDSEVREGRKTVTVLASLIATSGQGSGRAGDPEAYRAATERAAELAGGVIESHGGTVLDSRGGHVVGVFGMPRVHEDDAVRAVLAASELQDLATTSGDLVIKIRSGLATGEALVEDVGGVQSLLSSDPLDIAMRLEVAAAIGETLITQPTFRLAERAVRAEPTELVLLETTPPMAVFRLQEVFLEAGEGRLRPTFVGREKETVLLDQALDRVIGNRGCLLLTVFGPSGVGKSRLVTEFVDTVTARATVLRGRCLSYGSGVTFFPITEVVKRAAGIGGEDGPAEARIKIEGLLQDDEEAEFIASQVAATLGLADETPVPDEIFWAVRRLLEALARRRPLVVVVDDIHWADPTLLDLLENVATWSRHVPIMLVCLARPELLETRPGWGGGKLDATTISLEALTREESSALVTNLLGPGVLADAIRDRLLDAADGNPLFLEELLAMLIDEGTLQWIEGRWEPVGDLSSMPIPLSIQTLLSARLDRLARAERRLIERAAVIGKEFTEEDLNSLGEAEESVRPILEALARKDLIVTSRSSRSGGRAYAFRHLVIRDAAYLGTSKQTRASDHERFGLALERRVGERLPEYEEIVGYHLDSACRYRAELGLVDDHQRQLRAHAAATLASAGYRSFARDDMSAAASLLARALDSMWDDDAEVPKVCWRLGDALQDLGKFSEAEKVIEQGLEAAERVADEALEWKLRIQRADLRSWTEPEAEDGGRPSQIEIAEEALGVFARLNDLTGQARAHRLMGDANSTLGRQEEATEAYREATRLAILSGDEREIAERRGIGAALGPITVPTGIELIRASLEGLRRPNPEAEAQLAYLYGMAGRFDEARDLLSSALTRARELGVEFRAASISMYYAATLLLADESSAAEGVIRPAVEALQRMGERSLGAVAAALLAEALYRQHKFDEAMLATLMSEDASAPDDAAAQMAWRGIRAKILAVRGEYGAAERLARNAVAHGEPTDFLSLRGDAHVDLAIVLMLGDKDREALEQFTIAMKLFERKGNIVALAAAGALRDTVAGRVTA